MFFLTAVSILSALAYGRLFTEAPVANHDTYSVSGWGYPGQPVAIQAKVSHKHGSSTVFRYYKRYMENGAAAFCLPADPGVGLSTPSVSSTSFYPAYSAACAKGQARFGVFRGPPCLG